MSYRFKQGDVVRLLRDIKDDPYRYRSGDLFTVLNAKENAILISEQNPFHWFSGWFELVRSEKEEKYRKKLNKLINE